MSDLGSVSQLKKIRLEKITCKATLEKIWIGDALPLHFTVNAIGLSVQICH